VNSLELAHQLAAANEPFALATVVRCEPPASARPGAKAVIRPDGSMEGWVGGSCAQSLVIREAQRALGDGQARLVRLSPTAREGGQQRPGFIEYPMTCHSGGVLEIFVEPVTPRLHLYLVGETPVVRALAAMGRVLDYHVDVVDTTDASLRAALAPERIGRGNRTFVVIATMGMADEEALEAALRSPTSYVALVASPRRATVMRDYLAGRGVTPEQLDKLHAPAGLNLGAETPEEIALSILAEVVQRRSTLPLTAPVEIEIAPPPLEATDPVCGMSVAVADARFRSDHDETTYYFCCAQCQSRFEADPAMFAGVSG
jgi:xanthine dehydrogenase accessory factor